MRQALKWSWIVASGGGVGVMARSAPILMLGLGVTLLGLFLFLSAVATE